MMTLQPLDFNSQNRMLAQEFWGLRSRGHKVAIGPTRFKLWLPSYHILSYDTKHVLY